jgi:hypothetical protein
MIDPIRELKIRAEVLHKRVVEDPRALERLRALPELRKADEPKLRSFAHVAQRKHFLAVVAREAGFSSWEHALRVISGESAESDFGKLLYDTRWGAYLNVWCATYEEAKETHRAHPERYLLAYQRHFFLVERGFVEALGVSPDDEDWDAIGRDWARPRDLAARTRLYGKILSAARA